MSTITHERTEEQVEIDELVLRRVKLGLAWLEETHGPGWEDHIDMKTLNLREGEHCVLGQVYKNDYDEYVFRDGYQYALCNYDISGIDLGFSVWDESWDQLQKTWKYVLTPLVSHTSD